ncbi:alpha-1,4-galacturonosyltransferase [Marchantia polymorpha subsp. ruderalis]|uniref:Hexosyltransferase n=2 Tax=Marchantia polymorpha TaxID=3197 RepID=A0A176WPE9_MARPO|nr:hypothetical protein AXG93_1864s1170 [Marchantia polymorpha subsp. ruderalis]PTQ36195.1 hypothetical protein MARPO_0065s0017 [Marchantia polymorpha]BBM99760.1 hypothetical protein Mp_1g23600 [Marchantia polymorpha subsp. ruderalis]|eukprot:PTQ36195.1 hypothetical protein MARPO_0065s0017 [Marchantia polymorpha]
MRRRPGRAALRRWWCCSANKLWSAGGLLLCGVLFLYLSFGWATAEHRWSPAQKIKRMNGTFSSSKVLLQSENVEESSKTEWITRQLNDQMTLAKWFIVIAQENNNVKLAWELSAVIRSCQQFLSGTATRGGALLESEAEPILARLSALIASATEHNYDSATLIMKLKAKLQSLDVQATVASEQSVTFGQAAAEAMPKSLHCLGLKLTYVYGTDRSVRDLAGQKLHLSKFTDNSFYHFCIFSDNVLAVSVVMNSTVINAVRPDELIFHIVTDQVNYGAMEVWLGMNDFRGASYVVQRIEDFTWLNASYVPVMKQLESSESQSYYFKGNEQEAAAVNSRALKFRNPKYLSMLNHLRFYIPEIFPELNQVIFLDDDVIVQKDLTPLFSLDLHGNVNGAVETCLETFHRFHKYLNFSHPQIRSHFDPEACGWAFGMNVFDLLAWKRANVTERYHYWQEANADRTLWKLGTLPAGLLAFYGLIEPLDRSWHILGLGYDPNVDSKLIESAAVIHYNGNMKPWLKLAMSRYKPYWDAYVNFDHPILQECNFQ